MEFAAQCPILAFQTSQLSGYFDCHFFLKCPKCGDLITKENLAVLKFAKNLVGCHMDDFSECTPETPALA